MREVEGMAMARKIEIILPTNIFPTTDGEAKILDLVSRAWSPLSCRAASLPSAMESGTTHRAPGQILAHLLS
jgi:hypothetical protein